MFPKRVGFPPKSSHFTRVSIIFTIHFGVFPPIFGNTHVYHTYTPPHPGCKVGDSGNRNLNNPGGDWLASWVGCKDTLGIGTWYNLENSYNWLVVEPTHLKNISRNGNLPQFSGWFFWKKLKPASQYRDLRVFTPFEKRKSSEANLRTSGFLHFWGFHVSC